jgi:hypothetical protein
MMQEVKHPGTEGPFNPRRETGGETRSPDGAPTMIDQARSYVSRLVDHEALRLSDHRCLKYMRRRRAGGSASAGH